MNPPSCTTCKHFFGTLYCDRKVKVTGYDIVYGREILKGEEYCRTERNSFTLFGFPDICGKQGKYWEK